MQPRTFSYPCKDDPHRIIKRVRYICYGKTRKQTECDGQTGYTAHVLDGIVDKLVRRIFERMNAIPKSEIVNLRYREKMEERKALLQSVQADYNMAAAELDTLRAEVIKSIRGESVLSTLSSSAWGSTSTSSRHNAKTSFPKKRGFCDSLS